jgi:hypothetical protein
LQNGKTIFRVGRVTGTTHIFLFGLNEKTTDFGNISQILYYKIPWHPEVNQVSWWSNTKNLTYKMDILWCFMQHLQGC